MSLMTKLNNSLTYFVKLLIILLIYYLTLLFNLVSKICFISFLGLV